MLQLQRSETTHRADGQNSQGEIGNMKFIKAKLSDVAFEVTRPKSMFGKVPYMEEQRLMVKLIRPVSLLALEVSPEKYSLYYGLPQFREVFNPEKAKQDYMEHYTKARGILKEMGV
jgi:hypothetical protein